MQRYSNTPDRDERGRFISDDDRRSSRANYDDDRRSSSSRYDDDNRGYSRDRRHDEDDRGSPSRARSSRYDDDRRSSSSRYDDDRGYSRDHGQGGWFGDPQGHSEAARRGWDNRRDEDDDGRSYARDRR